MAPSKILPIILGFAGLALASSNFMRPVTLKDLSKRSNEMNFASLSPSQQAQLLYAGANNTLLANMTLHAEDGQLLVLMEEFDDLTSSVDCNGDDGKLQLVFKDQASYSQALKEWSYINDDAQNSFLLIANNKGCGPDDERVPYQVHNVDDSDSTFTVDLNATAASWGDVAKTYSLDFGHVGHQTASIARRFCIPGITDCSEDKTASASISLGQENNAVSIFSDDIVDITCNDCFMSGGLTLEGKLEVDGLSLKTFSIQLSTSGVRSALEVETNFKTPGDFSPSPMTLVQKMPLPDAGINIPHLFNLGLFAELDVGAAVQTSGSLDITAGFQASIPDTANVILDLHDMSNTGAHNWDQSTFQPVFQANAQDVTVSGQVWLQPRVSLQASITALGDLEAGVDIRLPQVDLGATINQDQSGNGCPGSNTVMGLDLSAAVEVQLDLDMTASIKDIIDTTTSIGLMSTTLASASTCIGFGSGPTTSSTTSSAPASTSAQSTPPGTGAPIVTGTGSASGTGNIYGNATALSPTFVAPTAPPTTLLTTTAPFQTS